jgi:hypothetical protein
LKALSLFVGSVRSYKSLVEFADFAALFEQARETLPQDNLTLVFVELIHYNRHRKFESHFLVRVTNDPGGIELPNPWTRVDPVKNHLATRPQFPQSVSLDFPDCRELVIVPLQKGRLRVSDQKHAAHASPGFRNIGTSHDGTSVTPVILPIL